MSRADLQNLEPLALGRYAFWQGRPITVNPLIGPAAREWAVGWRRGLTELMACLPPDQQDVQALPTTEQRRLLRVHCPRAVPPLLPLPRENSSRAPRTARRA
jgi:hypothetical protein